MRTLQIFFYAVTMFLTSGSIIGTTSALAEAGVDFGSDSSNERITVKIGEPIPATTKINDGHWEIVDFNKVGIKTVSVVLEARIGQAPGYKNASIIPYAKGARIPGEDKSALTSDHPSLFKIEELGSPDYNAPDLIVQKYNRAGVTRMAETLIVGEATHVTRDGQKTPALPKGYQWKEASRATGLVIPIHGPGGKQKGGLMPDIVTYKLDYDFSKVRSVRSLNDRIVLPAMLPGFLWIDNPKESKESFMKGAAKTFEDKFGRAPFGLIPLDMAPYFMSRSQKVPNLAARPQELPRRVRKARPKGATINRPTRRPGKFR